MWTLPNLKLGVKKMWQGNRLLIKQLRRNRMHPVNQTKLWGQTGHTMYTCLQPQFITWKQSSGSSGGSTDENMTTLWMIWTWTWLFGAYFWIRLFEHDANLRYVKNHFWNSVGQLFNETGKLISEQKEITGVSTIGFKDATWMSASLLCEKAYRITNAKVYVFSDSVLCVEKMGDDLIATWKSKI